MKHLTLVIWTSCLILIGCSSTNTITLSVEEQARISLPSHVTRIGVINRTARREKPGRLETVDQVLSLKSGDLDSLGAAAGINALFEVLSKDDRFDAVVSVQSDDLNRTAYGVFPAPLQWDQIAKLCEEHDLNGVFSLEWYDTDTRIDYDTRKVTREGPLGVRVPLLEHHANVETAVHTGWRIYDYSGSYIVDEYVLSESVLTTGRGINPVEAIEAVTGRSEAIQTVSGNIGRAYAVSILPYWTRVRRRYYVRGNENFRVAKRRAQTGNWDGAAELWLEETRNSNEKVAGRAHYNMAIVSEIRGDVDASMEWARTAYEEYGDKRALRYLRALQDRKAKMIQGHAAINDVQ